MVATTTSTDASGRDALERDLALTRTARGQAAHAAARRLAAAARARADAERDLELIRGPLLLSTGA